jgi:hypothetical protein
MGERGSLHPEIARIFIDQECEGPPEERNVNSGGPTTFLWIKRLFGFCGELWWLLGFLGIALGFCLEFWVATDGNRAFSPQNKWTICGE